MKNVNKEEKIFNAIILATKILVILSITFAIGYSVIKAKEDVEELYSTMTFKYDEKTGKTIPVGKGAEDWIPAEDYHDDSWSVDYDNVIMKNDIPMYKGIIDGEERIATKEYWNAVALSKQPMSFFGYVYIGD